MSPMTELLEVIRVLHKEIVLKWQTTQWRHWGRRLNNSIWGLDVAFFWVIECKDMGIGMAWILFSSPEIELFTLVSYTQGDYLNMGSHPAKNGKRLNRDCSGSDIEFFKSVEGYLEDDLKCQPLHDDTESAWSLLRSPQTEFFNSVELYSVYDLEMVGTLGKRLHNCVEVSKDWNLHVWSCTRQMLADHSADTREEIAQTLRSSLTKLHESVELYLEDGLEMAFC